MVKKTKEKKKRKKKGVVSGRGGEEESLETSVGVSVSVNGPCFFSFSHSLFASFFF
jgi:hypothetical protein